MPTLLSVNVGRSQIISGKVSPTGILKQPQSGPVAIGTLGIAGDAVLDRKHHGGPDQALYAYFAPDYDWWMEELGTPLEPGTFGENLTIGGLDTAGLAIGDRFAIADAVLEITSHREPCSILAARMGDPKFVRRFHKAHRPGAYLRIISPGTVSAGMEVAYQPFAGDTVTLHDLVDGVVRPDAAFLRRALAAPLHYKMRADFEERLAKLG